TDTAFTAEDERHAEAVTAQFVPEGFRAEVSIAKLVAAPDLVARRTMEILMRKHRSVAALVSEEDILVEEGEDCNFVRIGLSSREQSIVGEQVLDSLSAELEKVFCGTFRVGVFTKEKEAIAFEDDVEEEEFVSASRYFEIADYQILDGAEKPPKYATYIADGANKEGEMNLCGEISYIEEKETAKGKPFFRFTISDGTGSIRGMYFTRKATVDKIRELKAGDWIVCSGVNELFNGGLSFHVKKINLGRTPENFVPQKRPSRPVPKAYHTVFPEPIVDYEQEDLFGKESLPKEFLAQEFVVFDLETTGLSNNPAMGSMDKIIEIGAVRIREGKIREKFSSFIACPARLSPEIVSLTGITDDMLVGAPDVHDVLIDFYKFADGASLVGHNVMFDYKFISYYGEEADVRYDAKLFDTVTIAQSTLVLSNYKLNTLADAFGVIFNHHRAFDDALATAKIFIELIRMKKCLPN
ncbi:MAG: exonuclease domain-containing protein, partial [Christensenellaceae bacterium]